MRKALSSVSEMHLQFVEYASAEAKCLDRAQFKALDEAHCAITDPIQAWPTFLGEKARAEMERVSTGLCRLIKRLPALIFDYDAGAISEYYDLLPDFIRHYVLGATTEQVIEGAFGRADFVMTTDRLWCVEFNLASNVGGLWEAPAWQRKMASIPIIAEYMDRLSLKGQSRNSLRLMMRHVYEHARRHESGAGAEVNVAYAIAKDHLSDDEGARTLQGYFAEEYAEVLREMGGGARGDFFLCGFQDLNLHGGRVFFQGRPIHSLVEATAGDVPLRILRCHQRGAFTLHNGPVTYILCNKLNMVLLSEFGQTGLFEEEDQELIRNHVPWTRKVARDKAVFDGVEVFLPSFIRENREELVLKKSISRSGYDVVSGIAATPEEWESALAHAFYERDWVVQQYIPCPLLPYQHGAYGWLPHRAVWGAFVFGDVYGGAFLRLLPEMRGAIVATSRGASDGVVLEVA